jgi:hypothetical protein
MVKMAVITLDNGVITVDRDGEKITDEKAVVAFLGELWKTAQNLYHANVSIIKEQGDRAASLTSLDVQLSKTPEAAKP